jgi:hypothetical protein
MMQIGPCWEVALELHPIEAVDLPLAVGLDEDVQLAIRNLIKDESIGADIVHRFWQLNSHLRIALGNDGIFINFPFRIRAPGSKTASKAKSNCEWFD